ncbi:type IV secretory system conjugative DNA transfer family protein [Deinococcus hopiensis]|uniref:Type IV secretory pathway, VirD4 component, TraG/TraD family ATPase n=1 Tax=Deinococcus hopiensis KR-140 TaxID=695939 RepID=A0A1W1U9U8_9DEIO|nr:type IV secretory system conjugative DNA transfer family protein [Deinococcus hopiensis]SMB77868.1 Type IV secretory pathway, VirD4 component, TraG/TraD family ATPase [Deinococcus hopiensis KR-140]
MIVNYSRFFMRYLLALGVFWVVAYLLLSQQPALALATLILGGVFVYAFKDSKQQVRYNAHFATPQEIRPLTRNVLEGDGVLLGFAYKQPLAVRPGLAGKKEIGHFLWIGPSRSGKGLSIASNLYHWEGSAIVVDIKGEIAEQTAGYREEVLGQQVFIINPSSGEKSHQYDPFLELETDEQIFSAALAFMNPDSDGDNAIFAQRASSALAAIIKAAKVQGFPVIPTLDAMLYHPQGLPGAAITLHKLGHPQITKWLNAFLSKDPDKMDWDAASGDRFLNNSWQRLITAASYLTTEGVMHMTGGSDFVAADLMRERTTVYLVFRESELALNLPLFNLVIDAIFRSIMRQYDLDKNLKGQKLLAVFDEAFRARPNLLPEYAATVAGRGIYMCVYVQSIAQITDIWGKEGKTSIMENIHTKVFLPAVDRSEVDKEGTSSFVAASCGKYMVEDRGIAKGEHQHELNSNVRLTEKELISASEFAMLEVGQSVVLTNNLPPILAYRLEPWRFREYKEAQQLPPPQPPARPVQVQPAQAAVENDKKTPVAALPEPSRPLTPQVTAPQTEQAPTPAAPAPAAPTSPPQAAPPVAPGAAPLDLGGAGEAPAAPEPKPAADRSRLRF